MHYTVPLLPELDLRLMPVLALQGVHKRHVLRHRVLWSRSLIDDLLPCVLLGFALDSRGCVSNEFVGLGL
jgi:hypothetical protein